MNSERAVRDHNTNYYWSSSKREMPVIVQPSNTTTGTDNSRRFFHSTTSTSPLPLPSIPIPRNTAIASSASSSFSFSSGNNDYNNDQNPMLSSSSSSSSTSLPYPVVPMPIVSNDKSHNIHYGHPEGEGSEAKETSPPRSSSSPSFPCIPPHSSSTPSSSSPNQQSPPSIITSSSSSLLGPTPPTPTKSSNVANGTAADLLDGTTTSTTPHHHAESHSSSIAKTTTTLPLSNNNSKNPQQQKKPIATTKSGWPLEGIEEPHDNDVLFGRGGGTNHHIGNKRFRKLVEDRKVLYVTSARLDKPLVAANIIHYWRNQEPPGRFLKVDESVGLWHDVGDKKAREKTSQALREKAPMIRKQQQHHYRNHAADNNNSSHTHHYHEDEGAPDEDSAAAATLTDGSSMTTHRKLSNGSSNYFDLDDDHEAAEGPGDKKNGDDPNYAAAVVVKSTRFAAGTNVEQPKIHNNKNNNNSIQKSMLARDHSLGRDYLDDDDEAMTVENFSWQDPFGEGNTNSASESGGTSRAENARNIHSPPPLPYSSTSTSSSSSPRIHHHSNSNPSNNSPYPPPPPPPLLPTYLHSTASRRGKSNPDRVNATIGSSQSWRLASSSYHRNRSDEAARQPSPPPPPPPPLTGSAYTNMSHPHYPHDRHASAYYTHTRGGYEAWAASAAAAAAAAAGGSGSGAKRGSNASRDSGGYAHSPSSPSPSSPTSSPPTMIPAAAYHHHHPYPPPPPPPPYGQSVSWHPDLNRGRTPSPVTYSSSSAGEHSYLYDMSSSRSHGHPSWDTPHTSSHSYYPGTVSAPAGKQYMYSPPPPCTNHPSTRGRPVHRMGPPPPLKTSPESAYSSVSPPPSPSPSPRATTSVPSSSHPQTQNNNNPVHYYQEECYHSPTRRKESAAADGAGAASPPHSPYAMVDPVMAAAWSGQDAQELAKSWSNDSGSVGSGGLDAYPDSHSHHPHSQTHLSGLHQQRSGLRHVHSLPIHDYDHGSTHYNRSRYNSLPTNIGDESGANNSHVLHSSRFNTNREGNNNNDNRRRNRKISPPFTRADNEGAARVRHGKTSGRNNGNRTFDVDHVGSGGNGSGLRPDLVKRATSHQNETEDTKPSLHGPSVKKASLNRDNSLVSSQLKAKYVPGYRPDSMRVVMENTTTTTTTTTGPGNRTGFNADKAMTQLTENLELSTIDSMTDSGHEQSSSSSFIAATQSMSVPHAQSLTWNGRMASIDQIAMDLFVRPVSLTSATRSSTIEALALDFEEDPWVKPERVERTQTMEEVLRDLREGGVHSPSMRPDILDAASRLTSSDVLKLVNEPLRDEEAKVLRKGRKSLPTLSREASVSGWQERV